MKKIVRKIGNHLRNLVLAPKNLIFRALNIPLKPELIVFMVTDRCNSRCNHCNIWREKKDPNPLTPKEIEKLFSDKLFKKVKYVICTGGEATVRDDLDEVFLSLHRAMPKATLQVSTNAILPERTMKLVETAMKNNIKLDVGVSLDGLGEYHDKVRGVSGNFAKADGLIRELVKLRDNEYPGRLNVAAGIVVSDLTIPSFYQVRDYAKNLNIDLVEAWYNASSFYSNCDDGSKSKIIEKITEIVESQQPSLLQEKWLDYLKGKSIKFPCFALNTFCVVKCNGELAPCLSQWDLNAGNMRDNNPSEVWNGDKARKFRKVIKNCKGCLNTWGAGYSFQASYYQILSYRLRHLKSLFQKDK